jgi:hypothetical protein
MVLNTTFNNISGILWWSVLLEEETEVPVENHDLPQVTDKLCHITLYGVHLAWAGFELTTLVVIGTDCIGSCNSNYHTITATTTPLKSNISQFSNEILLKRMASQWMPTDKSWSLVWFVLSSSLPRIRLLLKKSGTIIPQTTKQDKG